MNRVMCSTLTNEAFRYDSVCTAHMNNLKITNGPVIVIVDEIDDQELLVEVFEKLGYPNEILFFTNGQNALDYLNNTDVTPFLILSDINMPMLDGFALRNKIKMDEKLQTKCIPYLFFTTASTQKAVVEAYSMSVQGIFHQTKLYG